MEQIFRQEDFYYTYNRHLQKKFGCRVYKISLDGGFSCPNRDGSKGSSGCIFCDEKGSSSRTHLETTSIKDQVLKNLNVRNSRFRASKYIAYFQSFTNTYAPVQTLKKIYDEGVFAHPDIVGLSISTRADCIDDEKLSLIASYQSFLPYVCIEYGMQTIHNATLEKLNRKETHEDFVLALEKTKKHSLSHCAHVILGLPSETKEDERKTADKLANLQVEGVKIHLLVAMKDTFLEKELFAKNLWSPLCFEEATQRICDFLERLPPSCVIHRISGNGHPLHLVAPTWVYEKKRSLLHAICQEFTKRNTKQGSLCRYTT